MNDKAAAVAMFSGIVLLTAGVIGAVASFTNYTINVSPAYNKAAGGYFTQAYDASTFEVMRDNLRQGIAGLHRLGLVDTDYGRAWSWEQTPDWSMTKQYQYLDGLVNRTQYYINTFSRNNTSQYTDVYTAAMANMRTEFGRNGPVDWVAYPAWLLKTNGFYYWNGWTLFLALIAVGSVLIWIALNVW